MKRRAELEPGFVLHSYPYKETSLIVEVFSRRFGRVGLLARGARRPRSAMRGVLLAFHPLRLTWTATAELGTLMSVEWGGGQKMLSGIALMCGFYVNELLLRLLPHAVPPSRPLTRTLHGRAGRGRFQFRSAGCWPNSGMLRADRRGKWRRNRPAKHLPTSERGPGNAAQRRRCGD
jgi:hypothetical protein